MSTRPARPTAALLAAAGLALFLAVPAVARAQDEGARLGTVPELPILEDLAGEAVDLGALAEGRPVLLQFWATWCAVCKALQPSLEAAHAQYGGRAEFVIVSAAVAQTRDQVRRHLERMPVPGHVVWDVDGRATRALEAPGTGYVVVLDADGRVVYSGVGGDQDLVAAVAKALGARR